MSCLFQISKYSPVPECTQRTLRLPQIPTKPNSPSLPSTTRYIKPPSFYLTAESYPSAVREQPTDARTRESRAQRNRKARHASANRDLQDLHEMGIKRATEPTPQEKAKGNEMIWRAVPVHTTPAMPRRPSSFHPCLATRLLVHVLEIRVLQCFPWRGPLRVVHDEEVLQEVEQLRVELGAWEAL